MELINFVMPNKAYWETLNSDYGKFISEPLERGYGHTLGNALRRILLSSIEGTGVTQVRIEGALHEYATLPGVVEDVQEIIFNVKKLKVKLLGPSPYLLHLEAQKKSKITAADIQPDSNIEILNPELEIATLCKDVPYQMDIEVAKGRGFVPAESRREERKGETFIVLDTLFSPVVKVNYNVEITRVGRVTNYDRLILEIWTNKVVTPAEALEQSFEIILKNFNKIKDLSEKGEPEEKIKESEEPININKILSQPITDIELSVRALNCLQNAKIKTIGELVKQTEEMLLEYRNFGEKSLQEIKEKLAEFAKLHNVNLYLGMKLGVENEQTEKIK